MAIINKDNYYKQRDKKNINKVRQILNDLPYFCADYIMYIESSTTPLTRLNYISDIKLFLSYIAEKRNIEVKSLTYKHINEIKVQDLEMFLSLISNYEIGNKTLSNQDITKARKLSSIRNLLQFLYCREKIDSNVASKVRHPKIRTKEIVRLEVDEVANLINSAENTLGLSVRQQKYNQATKIRDCAIISLFLGTGIRVSECVGLNIEDIDFNNNAFKVTRKGGSSYLLYFSQEVAEALKQWLEKRASIKNLPENENALFVSLQNKRIAVRTVEKMVKKFASVATPLKKITPHKLRSTYGTNLYRETKDIYVVADVLGHKDINTTKKHYAAMSEDIRRSVASKVKLR